MLSKKVWFAIAGLLVVAGAAMAAGVAVEADATAEGKHMNGKRAGPFHRDGDSIEGRFVRFDVDRANGSLLAYTAIDPREDRTILLFESVTVSPYDASEAKGGIKGATYRAATDDAKLVAFNAPNAAIHTHARNATTFTYVVPAGVGIEYHGEVADWSPEGVLLRYADNVTARLVVRGNGTLSVDGQTITVSLGPDGSAAFRLDGHPRAHLVETMAMRKMRDGDDGPRGMGAEHRGPRAGGPGRDAWN